MNSWSITTNDAGYVTGVFPPNEPFNRPGTKPITDVQATAILGAADPKQWRFDGAKLTPPDGSATPDPTPSAPTLIPVPMLRQRIEKLGMWEDFSAYLAQNPAEMLKVLTLEGGVDPKYPAITAAFETMSIPQAQRDYILAAPSAGVPDVQLADQ